jgi:4-diphosphocytidyl-2-C-methyl-D-erythritol kinase
MIHIKCPAKLNLFLSVGPIDQRGYHPLRTIFQAISLYDELSIEKADELSFECEDPAVPEDNTVVKAARLMMEVADFPPLKIRLKKKIPIMAGLGGGSSDAAGVIMAGRQLMNAMLPAHELSAVAKAIGADVPFFLMGGRAQATGYGEILTKLPSPDPLEWYVIAQPKELCNTKDMFMRLDGKAYVWREFPELDELYNDFLRVCPASCLTLIDQLHEHGARDAGLTGSGSAIFGRFETERKARRAADMIYDQAPWIKVAHSL